MGAHPIGLFSPNSPEARLRKRRQQLRSAHRSNPQVAIWAVAATEIARLYPGAPAGVVVSMAQSGVSPHDPIVKEVMTEALMTNPPPGEEKAPKKGGGILGAVGDFVGGIDDAVIESVKPTIRTAATVVESGIQEFQAVVNAGGWAGVRAKEDGIGSFAGNFWEVFNDNASVGRRAIGDLVTGDDVELGEGFFPGGELAERRKREAERWTIDGNPVSIGRVVANEVFEPGTTGYNTMSGAIDGAVALAADPANVVLKSASLANKGRKTFFEVTDNTLTGRAAEKLGDLTGLRQRAGLVDANRKQLILDRANRWLDTEAADLVDELAGADDFLATYNFLGRKVRATTVADLVDARTPDEVRNVLRNEILEGNLRNKLPAGGSTFLNRRLPSVRQSRIFDMMPKDVIDFDDIDDAVEQSRRWMVNARLPDEDQARVLSRLVRAEDKAQMYDVVVRDMLATAERRLVTEHGVVPSKARGLVTFVSDDVERMRDYGISELTEDAAAVGIRVNGDMQRVMSPMLPNQLLNRGIPLPDPREIRRAVSDWAPVLNNAAVRVGENAMSYVQDKLWKRAVLLRGAWTVRVVGEEQFRIAGSGGESLVNRPLSAIAWATGRKGGSDVLGHDFGGVRDAMKAAALDEADDFASTMARGSMGLAGERKLSRFHQVVDQSDPMYFGALVDELAFLSNDPVARRVARGFAFDSDNVTRGGIDGVKDWWWKSAERKEMAGELPLMDTRQVADEYIDFVQGQIHSRTGGSDELRNLIGSRPSKVDPKLRTDLRNVIDRIDPGELPANVLADSMTAGRVDPSLSAAYDRATEVMFNGLMSIPTNKLSRSPHFRQQYWKGAEELLGLADEGAQRQILTEARKANLDKNVIRRMEETIAGGVGDLNLEHIDVVAKGHALDTTRDLLYDLSERHQLADMMRLVSPFGEAWFEVASRWAKIGRENPQVLRRTQQVIEGARDAGFFTTDEEGVETFVWPGSRMVTEALLGVPIESRGRVQGLSMMGEVLPGFGPAVQIPVAAVLPDIPEFDFVREIVNPFGEPEGEAALSSLIPSWMQKWQTSDWLNPLEGAGDRLGPLGGALETAGDVATGTLRVLAPRTPEQQRLYMSTVASTVDALAMTGEYDLHGENARDEGARLLEDAKRKARGIYALRSMAQFVAPTAPSVEMMAEDPNGKLVVIQEMADTFREYQEEDRDTAVERFLADFGENAFLLTEGKTTGVFGVSKEVEDWARRNPDLLEKYPTTYAFFGPTPPDDEAFDYDTYRRQIARGERIPRTPEEILHAAQHRVAAARMDQFNRIVGSASGPEVIVARDKLRRELVTRYPGFRPFDLSSDLEQNIEELRVAAADPKLADSDTARTVAKYLRVRDIMLKIAHARGRKDFSTSDDTQQLRDALRLVAVELQAENPAFGTVWERMLQYELRGREEQAFEESEAA